MIAAVLKIEAGDWTYEDDLGIPNSPQFFFSVAFVITISFFFK